MNKTRRILAILSLVGAILALSGVTPAFAQVSYVGEPPMHRGGNSVYPGGYAGSPYSGTNYGGYSYNPDFAITFTSAPVTVAYVGSVYNYRPIVNSAYGILPTIALENGPSGMHMDGSGMVVWTPNISELGQTFQVSLSARDPYSPARTFHNYFVTVSLYPGQVAPGVPVQNQTPVYTGTTGSTGTAVGGPTVTPAFLKETQGSSVETVPYRKAPIASLFGLRGDDSGELEIANVVAKSGPVNLYDDKPNTNCSVVVSWETNIPSAGRVVYGTKSQSAESFAYDFTASETVSSEKGHQVRLECLTSEVYYFRVVSFSENQRAVTEEMTIFPFKVDGVLASGSSSPTVNLDGGLASVFGTATRFFVNPFVLVLLLVIAVWIIISAFNRRSNKFKKDPVSVSLEPAEPMLFIPTAPEQVPGSQ